MDVQKTMEFILAQQAESAAWQAKADKRIDAVTKLLKTGMRMLANTDAKIKALTEHGLMTEAKFEALAGREANIDGKIDALIDAQIRNESEWRERARGIDAKFEAVAAQQAETEAKFKELAQRAADTDAKIEALAQRAADTGAKIEALVDAQRRNEDRLNRVAETLEKLATSQERLEASHQRLAEAHEELTKAHQETERSLNRFINSMTRRNGS